MPKPKICPICMAFSASGGICPPCAKTLGDAAKKKPQPKKK